jgi:hypothetical protein
METFTHVHRNRVAKNHHGVQLLAVSGRKVEVDWNKAAVIMGQENSLLARQSP